MNISKFGHERDHFFMREALAEAQKAFDMDEVPIGAIVVDAQGTIIGRGHNQVMARCSQAAHAELIALEQAGKKQDDWRLEGCWLYVTLEPCAMCINLVLLSRLEGIVYGAQSPLFGYQQQEPLDKVEQLPLYKKDAVSVISGVEAEAALTLLKQFFKQKRNDERGANS